ncbi:MAG: dihydroorotate dehydrogenase electron transfer subunit [Candidatus Magasanikbacteria bacterium]
MKSDNPTFLKISKIVDENPFVKTFYLQYELKSKPGQFVMLWIPGYDQKPFSIAYDDGQSFCLTIFKRGPATEKLFDMKAGDRVGISGPYGTSFTVDPELHYIMVAGGYGAAPLGNLAEALANCHPRESGDLPNKVADSRFRGNDNVQIDFIAGARNKNLLLFKDRLTKIENLKLHIATDDGSEGHKGYVTDLLSAILNEAKNPLTNGERDPSPRSGGTQDDNSHVLVVTCGPELMQKKVLDICNKFNIDCEVSIERYMKCGVGVCGQCAVDGPGFCMCQDGPVVKRELANKIEEFGKYHRDKSGAIVSL